MSSNKVALSEDKLFHFKIGHTSTVQCLHLGSMVAVDADKNGSKLLNNRTHMYLVGVSLKDYSAQFNNTGMIAPLKM